MAFNVITFKILHSLLCDMMALPVRERGLPVSAIFRWWIFANKDPILSIVCSVGMMGIVGTPVLDKAGWQLPHQWSCIMPSTLSHHACCAASAAAAGRC